MNLSTQVAVVTALLSLVLGVEVWLRRERTRTTLPFSLICISIFVFCAGKVLFLMTGTGLYGQLASVGGLFALSGFYYLLVVYLAEERRALDFSVVLLYVLAAVGSVLRFVLDGKASRFSDAELLSTPSILVTGIVAGASTLWIGSKALAEPAGRQRRLLHTLMALAVVLFGVYALEKAVRPLSPIQPWTLLAVSLVLYFLHLTVVRYSYFGFPELVGKFSVFLISAIFLAVVYGLLVFLIGATPVRFGFHTLVAAFLLLVLYEPILSRVEAGTVRWLFRGGGEKRRKLGTLARSLAETISVDQVLAFLKDDVPRQLGFTSAGLYFAESGKFTRSGADDSGPPWIESESLRELLDVAVEPIAAGRLRRKALDSYPGADRDRLLGLVLLFEQMSATVLLPLRRPDSLLGFWAIDTGAGPELHQETGEVLMSLADQASVRIENARIYQRLKIKDRMATLGELSAGLAHEIRNPLGSMKGAAEYIKDEPLPETSREFVQIILEEAARLNEVLGRFLDFARPFKLNLENQDVHELVERTSALIRADDAAVGISLLVRAQSPPLICMLDPELIRQVLINLIKNGMESMDGLGQVRIAVSSQEGSVTIDVQDDGPGIPPERIDRLFEPFFSTKKTGSGLGLAISLRICEAHGGALTVLSAPGQGTVFSVRLPVDGPPAEAYRTIRRES